MSLVIESDLIGATTGGSLQALRDHAARYSGTIEVDTNTLSDAGLRDLADAASRRSDKGTTRAINSILSARAGNFDAPIPNFKAFRGVLEAFLKSDVIDGWIYVRGNDGLLYPELVQSISFDDGNKFHRKDVPPSVTLHTICYGYDAQDRTSHRCSAYSRDHRFAPQDVANRRLSAILTDKGIFKETPELREAYRQSLQRHHETVRPAFAKQFRLTGSAYRFESDDYRRRGERFDGRRVINDLDAADYGPSRLHAESFLFDGDGATGNGNVPEHPIVRLFDLRTHEHFWAHADNLTPYQYDKSLRDKLVLPTTHRELLDVLTTDIAAFVSDIVEGKSAGNVILCKGVPGVGKTLTAEVYAELTERPLYSIHSGELGTTAEAIEASLKAIFQRCKRWDCVLLLDEADVFVVRRGTNLEQNAIVAEFLRALEYFDGLLFMTTNRPDDIDEAILSRCAAVIDYSPPDAGDRKAIWRVMSDQYNANLSSSLIDELVAAFPSIVARDIKMLLRLALRVAAAQGAPLTIETLRRCAMFRAVAIAT